MGPYRMDYSRNGRDLLLAGQVLAQTMNLRSLVVVDISVLLLRHSEELVVM
jgi:hypothetical protein